MSLSGPKSPIENAGFGATGLAHMEDCAELLLGPITPRELVLSAGRLGSFSVLPAVRLPEGPARLVVMLAWR